jgi:transcriptional regulator CtsR
MIDKFLKTAGVDNMEDFYKLHPTEEHFFKTYPHMKNKMNKGKKIRRAQKGGVMPNSLSRPSVPIDHYAGTYAPAKLRMQEGGEPQQEMMQQVMQMISGALEQGAEPKQIMQMLMQQGVPAEAAQQLMQMVMQQMSGVEQTYADGGRLPKEVLRSRLESHMSPAEADDYLSTYAKGGIHIDPAKKGTFRAQATRMGMSVKEAARHIMANKENYSPAMVKKAVFAHNFAKQDGGYAMPSYQAGTSRVTPFQSYMNKYQGYPGVQGGQLAMDTMARYDPVNNPVNLGFAPTPGRIQQVKDLEKAFTDTYGNKEVTGMDEEDAALYRVGTPKRAYGGYSVPHYQAGTSNVTPFQSYVNKYGPESATDTIARYDPAHNWTNTGFAPTPGRIQQQKDLVNAFQSTYGDRDVTGMDEEDAARLRIPYVKKAHGGYYQEGGEAMPQEMMEGAPQQMQEQAMGQEQQQGGQDQMMQQLMQMVMQALQEGMQPEQIMQMLVQQGVPEDVAMQVIQMVMQQMGGAPQGGPGEQYQSQGEQYQGPQAMAAYGGMYQIGGVTPHGAGTHGQQYTIKNGVAIPMGAYGGYYADGGFFNESYMPFDY